MFSHLFPVLTTAPSRCVLPVEERTIERETWPDSTFLDERMSTAHQMRSDQRPDLPRLQDSMASSPLLRVSRIWAYSAYQRLAMMHKSACDWMIIPDHSLFSSQPTSHLISLQLSLFYLDGCCEALMNGTGKPKVAECSRLYQP